MNQFDVVIIGAGAAGMMCALEALKRGRAVRLLDHAPKIGEKIRISGGGRCNFTNLGTKATRFVSQNPHFCKSALKRYSARDFVRMVEQHEIAWFEKQDPHNEGALFCERDAGQIIDMFLSKLKRLGVEPELEQVVTDIQKTEDGFVLTHNRSETSCTSLVIATGGKSIPKIGATGFGFKVAEQFGLTLVEPRPALVPLTFDEKLRADLKNPVRKCDRCPRQLSWHKF